MMLNRLLPLLIVSLAIVSGFAADVCNTLPECQQLKAQLDARIQAFQVAQIGDIARNADGSVLMTDLDGASKYCSNQGMRLPSLRELAQLSQSMGAAGSSDTPQKGYELNMLKNTDGKYDIFYFKSDGYKTPSGDLGDHWFFSSSVHFYGLTIYGLEGSSGALIGADMFRGQYRVGAVRCVDDRMLNPLLPTSIVSLESVSGFAADVCNTLPECQQLKAQVDARIQAFQVAQISDIARNADGSVLMTEIGGAFRYCSSHGMRLPTARELAQWSQSMGAAGFSDTPKEGYERNMLQNADGNYDIFYFKHAGYKTPAGDLGGDRFFSSSAHFMGSTIILLDGRNGALTGVGMYHGYYTLGAVRCVDER